MSSITPNILELLGSFFLGFVVCLTMIWTFAFTTQLDDNDDDDQPPTDTKEKHA